MNVRDSITGHKDVVGWVAILLTLVASGAGIVAKFVALGEVQSNHTISIGKLIDSLGKLEDRLRTQEQNRIYDGQINALSIQVEGLRVQVQELRDDLRERRGR